MTTKKWKDLRAKMPPDAQARVAARTAELLAELPLHELRRARSMTQETLAEALDIKQSGVSKLEQRTDIYISTLRRYIEALGGQLDIVARFPDGDVRVDMFGELKNNSPIAPAH